jgi:hypothetical protein
MPIESFIVGDKVVPRDPKFWLCGNYGIWTVKRVGLTYIHTCCRANDGPHKQPFLPLDIIWTYQKDSQMLLFPALLLV